MNPLYVTGCNAAFFNSFLICLQSFAEQMPGQRLFVCDFGITEAQAQFLRSLGVLLARPPFLASRGVFHCKAALLRYLRHNGHALEDHDAIAWLDADLTLMEVGPGDFQAMIREFRRAGADIAACTEPSGRNIGQMADTATMAPFARRVADTAIDRSLPYFSTGMIFCRSAAVLERWEELTNTVAEHPLFEQNMFNVAVHQNAVPFLTLDCEEWQAQGQSLDRVQLIATGRTGRVAARIGLKNIKTLHATSSEQGHLLIASCRMTVRNIELNGPFKVFLAEPLRVHQLQLLASFMATHGEALLQLGICARAARPAAGFEFVTL